MRRQIGNNRTDKNKMELMNFVQGVVEHKQTSPTEFKKQTNYRITRFCHIKPERERGRR